MSRASRIAAAAAAAAAADPEVLPEDRAMALRTATKRRGLIGEHLDRLAALPAHGNRTLRIDQLTLGLLLAFFDPFARSLRTIEDKGNFDGQLDLPRMARSTTADALAVFDPTHLQPLIDDLRERVPDLSDRDPTLAGITRRIIAADGTHFNTLADVAWALHSTRRNGRPHAQVRANVQMDVATWTPQVITVSGDDEESEPAAFARDLLADVLYVVDRNFVDFNFLRAVLDRSSDLVLRIRANAPAVAILQDLALTPADAEAGVVSDQLVELTGADAPPGTWRLVTIHTTNRKGEPETIRLLTSLTDAAAVPARVIGAIYQSRWNIELFFKWLKTWARMDHLLSTSKNGVTFQLYVAMIGVLMMYVQTGRRVSIYALAALSRLARGECTLQEAMAVIAKREREAAMNRARQARLRARKKMA